MGKGCSLPVASIAPALAAHKPALAVPVGRVGTAVAVLAADVATSLGPVLEVVAALTRVKGVLGLGLGPRQRTCEHTRCHKASREQ